MRTSPPRGTHVVVYVEDVPDASGPGLRQSSGESPPYDGLDEQTRSSQTPGSHSAESASEVCASNHDTSKVAKTEDPIKVSRRIVENSEVLSPNSPASPTDNYHKNFG